MFKPIRGYDDRYEIDEYGNIRSLSNVKSSSKGLIRKHQLDRFGYHRITLHKNSNRISYSVHRLVYETFKGDIPEGYEINHIDGNKSNNHIDNLELVTHQENSIHARNVLDRWSNRQGENSSNNKLTNEDVYKIRELAKSHTRREIAAMYGLSHVAINHIVNRKTWNHI